MSKPVILAVGDDPSARYLPLTAGVAPASGEVAMSSCFAHRSLATI